MNPFIWIKRGLFGADDADETPTPAGYPIRTVSSTEPSLSRRGFLKAMGVGAAAVVIAPAPKLFFVPSNAPVGSRIEVIPADVQPTSYANFAFDPDDVEEGFWPLKAGRPTSVDWSKRGEVRIIPHKHVRPGQAYMLAGDVFYVNESDAAVKALADAMAKDLYAPGPWSRLVNAGVLT